MDTVTQETWRDHPSLFSRGGPYNYLEFNLNTVFIHIIERLSKTVRMCSVRVIDDVPILPVVLSGWGAGRRLLPANFKIPCYFHYDKKI